MHQGKDDGASPAAFRKFLVMSDLHLRAARPLHGIDPARRVAAALNHARRHHRDAAALVLLGDLVHDGTPEDYARLAALLVDLPWPVHFLLGNHDDRSAFRAAFPAAPVDRGGFVQSSALLGRHRLIFLDSFTPPAELPRLHAGLLGPERLGFLTAELEAAAEAGERALVFVHHPPVPVGIPGLDAIGLLDGADFLATLTPHAARIDHLFFAHVHRPIAGAVALPVARIPFTIPASTTIALPFPPPPRGPLHDPALPTGYAIALVPDERPAACGKTGLIVHHEILAPKH